MWFSAIVVMGFGGDVFPVVLQSVTDLRGSAGQTNIASSPTITESGATMFRSCDVGCPIAGIDCGCLRISDAEFASLLEQAPRLKWLNLSKSTVTRNALGELEHVHTLQILGLSIPALTDDDLIHIEELVALETLNLAETQITDDGLVHLQGLTNLEWLDLTGARITDKGLLHLTRLSELHQLNLYDTRVTEDGVDRFQQALPSCSVFH